MTDIGVLFIQFTLARVTIPLLGYRQCDDFNFRSGKGLNQGRPLFLQVQHISDSANNPAIAPIGISLLNGVKKVLLAEPVPG